MKSLTAFHVDESRFLNLISGSQQGAIPGLKRGCLAALSLFYGLAVRLRNRAFDVGLKKTHRADVPVISIGNITTGGTGKTPMVAYVANWFRERGVQPVVLSRGYRSLDGETNDEKLVLDRLCPGTPHLQNPDRVASAHRAVAEHAAQVLILDDGFQHRRLHRDLNIVLIDALNPFGYGKLLPRGLLREPLSELKRADIVLVTRADQSSDEEKNQIRETVSRLAPDVPIAEVAFHAEGLVNLVGETKPLSHLKNQPVVGFCGIGNPESFRRTLSGCEIKAFEVFPDHHHYTAEEIAALQALANEHRAESLVTTLKDLVKIPQSAGDVVPVWAVGISCQLTTEDEILANKFMQIFPELTM